MGKILLAYVVLLEGCWLKINLLFRTVYYNIAQNFETLLPCPDAGNVRLLGWLRGLIFESPLPRPLTDDGELAAVFKADGADSVASMVAVAYSSYCIPRACFWIRCSTMRYVPVILDLDCFPMDFCITSRVMPSSFSTLRACFSSPGRLSVTKKHDERAEKSEFNSIADWHWHCCCHL